MNKWIKLANLSLLSTTLIACSKPVVVDEAEVDDNVKEVVNIYIDYGHEVETQVVDDE